MFLAFNSLNALNKEYATINIARNSLIINIATIKNSFKMKMSQNLRFSSEEFPSLFAMPSLFESGAGVPPFFNTTKLSNKKENK